MMCDTKPALRRFTRRLTVERRVEDALHQAASATFGDKGIVDKIVLAGYYQSGVFGVERFEMPAPDPVG
jgi:hypothetical protein